MTEIRVLPAFLEDTAQAARWYDEEGYLGLWDRFVGVFYAWLPHIQQHGMIYRPVYMGFRRILLRPFPYAVYYRHHADWVIIALVIHAARNPILLRKLLWEREKKST